MKYCYAIFCIFVYSASARAEVLVVPTATFPTIQSAVNAAIAGDSVEVGMGTYFDLNECVIAHGNSVICFANKDNITLYSAVGMESTVIDGGINSTGGILVHTCTNIEIVGFTIANSCDRNVWIKESTNIILHDCKFMNAVLDGVVIDDTVAEIYDNAMESNGRCGLVTWRSSVNIHDNIISSNVGDGIQCHDMIDLNALGNIIQYNQGDGINIQNTNAMPTIQDNLITHSGSDGIQYDSNQDALISSCTIALNEEAGIHFVSNNNNSLVQFNLIALNEYAGLAVEYGINPMISCNDVWGNSNMYDGNYIGYINDQTGNNGNISLDPLFCNADLGDFTLEEGSPSLTQECGPMGVYSAAGCSGHTATEQKSWGAIKSMYKQ